ncbi:MAG: FAD-dependent oxidoreductase [bacterium]|nr:FAD-dependent oxidoreductase [bacterium]
MKYLILGAGPAGLSVAGKLNHDGENSFLVLEKEQEAGGLCRSAMVDGAPFDIGGGHFLDVRRPKVNEFLFQFMPEKEWDLYTRNSQIKLKDAFVHHPLEANIWELPENLQNEYLDSISRAGCNQDVPMPDTFVEWIRWKLGDRITDDYMLPYNQKMFSDELNELGTYWLEKLPNVSYKETLESCKQNKAYGTQPGHAQFYYPKKTGYGELWNRIADRLGDRILYGVSVKGIDFTNRSVTVSDGRRFSADVIINTIPWKEFTSLSDMPEELIANIAGLKHSSIETRYFAGDLHTDAQWIYVPDECKPYHRILVRSNFCPGSRGYWTETRKERTVMFSEEDAGIRFENEYAYPLNTVGKQEIMEELLQWCEKHGVYGLGRWGEHQHYNSDVTVERALALTEKLQMTRA